MCGHHIFCFEDVHQFINFIQTNEMVLNSTSLIQSNAFVVLVSLGGFVSGLRPFFFNQAPASPNLSDDVGYFWTLLTNIFRMKIDFKRPI